jgi:hypothetical protein
MAEPNVMTRREKILGRYQQICTINDHVIAVHVPPMRGEKI